MSLFHRVSEWVKGERVKSFMFDVTTIAPDGEVKTITLEEPLTYVLEYVKVLLDRDWQLVCIFHTRSGEEIELPEDWVL